MALNALELAKDNQKTIQMTPNLGRNLAPRSTKGTCDQNFKILPLKQKCIACFCFIEIDGQVFVTMMLGDIFCMLYTLVEFLKHFNLGRKTQKIIQLKLIMP